MFILQNKISTRKVSKYCLNEPEDYRIILDTIKLNKFINELNNPDENPDKILSNNKDLFEKINENSLKSQVFDASNRFNDVDISIKMKNCLSLLCVHAGFNCRSKKFFLFSRYNF